MDQQDKLNQERSELFARLEEKKAEYAQSLEDLTKQSEKTEQIADEYKTLVKELDYLLADFPEDLHEDKKKPEEDFAKSAARFTEKAVGAIQEGASALFSSLSQLGAKLGDTLKNTGDKSQSDSAEPQDKAEAETDTDSFSPEEVEESHFDSTELQDEDEADAEIFAPEEDIEE